MPTILELFNKSTWVSLIRDSRYLLIALIYSCLLLDNILLTMVVPIVPDYINTLNAVSAEAFTSQRNLDELSNNTIFGPENEIQTANVGNGLSYPLVDRNLKYLHNLSMRILYTYNRHSHNMHKETKDHSNIGVLFASKAIFQLMFNPVVGKIVHRFGNGFAQLLGSLTLIFSSLLFAFGESYGFLLLARSVHGCGSALIFVSGMSIVADRFPEEDQRCRVMGKTLSGCAVGVLVGYPFGGLTYSAFNKTIPFLVYALVTALLFVCQLYVLKADIIHHCCTPVDHSIKELLQEPEILLATAAICVSTSAMAILEPCLPVWLLDKMNPPKWQLGTVFIPDSIGYLVGTNYFGDLAYNYGRWFTCLMSLLLIGFCTVVIPLATRIHQLIFPHFGLGLGVGIVDAAIMPHFAYLVDTKYSSSYGTVYTFCQLAVCIAYSAGPIFGSQFMKAFGFTALMCFVAFVNIIYALGCLFLAENYLTSVDISDNELQHQEQSRNPTSQSGPPHSKEKSNYESIHLINTGRSYVRFTEED